MWRDALFVGLVVAAACIGGAVDAAEPVRILSPSGDEILYGPTEVRIEVDSTPSVGAVLVYLDAFERPICRMNEEPFVCQFDAGTSFQGTDRRRQRGVSSFT